MSLISGAMYAYADLTGPGALGVVDRALDADPDLRPARLDTKVAATTTGGVQRLAGADSAARMSARCLAS